MSRPKKKTRCLRIQLFILCIVSMGLSACATTTIRPVSNSFATSMTAQDMAGVNNSGSGNMEKRSYDELLSIGQSYLDSGNFQLAKLHFGMALQKKPDSVVALTGLGIVLYREGQIDSAMKPLQAALDIDGKHVKALLPAGKIMVEKGYFTEALRYLDAAYAFAPDNPAVLTELAITYDSIGEEEKAQPLYERASELRPYQSAVYNNLGFNFLLQGKYQKAITILAKALQLDKTNIQARNNLAAAYAFSGEEKRAFALLQGTVGEAGAYNNLGYFYMTSGQLDRAEKLFVRAMEASPRLYLRSKDNLQQLKRLRSGIYK